MNKIESFPDKLLRGISDPKVIGEYGIVTAQLFQFSNDTRNDLFLEESINWEDDDGSLECLKNQKKKDSDQLQFKEGIAVLERNKIDELLRRFNIMTKLLSYERKAIEDNKYHGNLLMLKTLEKNVKVQLRASIANCVEKVIKSE